MDRARQQREAEKWAAALAQVVTEQCRALPKVAGSPDAWRPSDELMTQPSPAGAAAAQGEESVDPPARLTLRVDAGDLGQLELVVCRRASGIGVFIGTENPGARAVIEPERASLLSALASAGIAVESLEVWRTAVGTVLAPWRPDAGSRPKTPPSPDPKSPGPRAQRRSRKLNLVG